VLLGVTPFLGTSGSWGKHHTPKRCC